MADTNNAIAQQVVQITYDDLRSGKDLSKQVKEAFDKDGMGLIAVTGLPDDYLDMCKNVHSAVRAFANLPEEERKQFEVPPFYQRGWDHGHELMKDGHPDLSKGSFYFNPGQDAFEDVDAETAKKYPTFFGKNVFPKTQVPEFEPAVKRCSKFMQEVGVMLASQCDKLFTQPKTISEGEPGLCESIAKQLNRHACRGLYYFPTAEGDKVKDGWCGWHNDHCLLTGLIPGQFFEEPAGNACESPDPDAGLYICTRSGQVVKPRPPKNAMLFQIGETAQILSGGALRATPHMVRPPRANGVARTTMPIFMQPGHELVLDMPANADDDALLCPHLPEGVPTLASRYTPGVSFGDFSNTTFAAYYNQK
ncbi:hypothetical protein PTSG_02297 [Salpingoeca rosetta]|uniref:Non-haem dioxygenase N-terminal domain-containing protein n=1 Tax=Salpingoeca rosetta (strain ATCC 50818 / BSB-021) TaxID=946362 RepID=F2U1T0_SALR5|nr:uncharacterized protein PTSG_02297 [Salpingoeca rosetta]EGD81582.1 hypothetical protein PTSG_02297 [Salpingoeca rosetta]|eukprot:XP_004996786.1 hypothetical protein PTSG_02297 [Salpingoeca rosetta]